MLRSRLTHPLRERRPHRRSTDKPGTGAQAEARELEARLRAQEEAERDLQRVRRAGGPLDRACYTCACGYIFTAEVSTSVACPHCGAGQAW
jgi:rubrerythrin